MNLPICRLLQGWNIFCKYVLRNFCVSQIHYGIGLSQKCSSLKQWTMHDSALLVCCCITAVFLIWELTSLYFFMNNQQITLKTILICLTGGQCVIPCPPKKYSAPWITIAVCLGSNNTGLLLNFWHVMPQQTFFDEKHHHRRTTRKNAEICMALKYLPNSFELFSCQSESKC